MNEPINLRRARKQRARQMRDRDAAAERAKHGQSKHIKSIAEATSAKARASLDAHKRDVGEDLPAEPSPRAPQE